MSESTQWRQLAEFGAGYEADAAEAVLGAYDIPVLRKGPEVGIFGAGFAGPTAHGVALFVPAARWDEATAALHPLNAEAADPESA
jgi:hypothetical protein